MQSKRVRDRERDREKEKITEIKIKKMHNYLKSNNLHSWLSKYVIENKSGHFFKYSLSHTPLRLKIPKIKI